MSKGRPWYKHYPGDFLNGVIGLDYELRGCYFTVIDMMYDRGGPIPNDPKWIGASAHCSARRPAQLITRLIDIGKLFETPAGLSQMRVEIELAKQHKATEKLAENAQKSTRKRIENLATLLKVNNLSDAERTHRARVQIPQERKKEEVEPLARLDGERVSAETMPPSQGSRESANGKAEDIAVSPALAAKYTRPAVRH